MSQVQYRVFAAIGSALTARRLSADAMVIMHEASRAAVGDSGNAESETAQALPGLYTEKFEITGHSSEERDYQVMAEIKNVVAFAPQNFIVHRFTGGSAPVAYIGKIGQRMFEVKHSLGALKEFNFTADLPTEQSIMVGQPMENTWEVGETPYIASGATAGIELPAIGAGYEGVFAIAIGADPDGIGGTTPTMNGELQSDTSGAFASPATMATLDEVTTVPSLQVFYFDGDADPTADTFYRFDLTLGGTNPSYEVFAAGAIMKKLGVE